MFIVKSIKIIFVETPSGPKSSLTVFDWFKLTLEWCFFSLVHSKITSGLDYHPCEFSNISQLFPISSRKCWRFFSSNLFVFYCCSIIVVTISPCITLACPTHPHLPHYILSLPHRLRSWVHYTCFLITLPLLSTNIIF